MKIAILGVGFLGLKLADFFSKEFKVVCADINPRSDFINKLDATNKQEIEEFFSLENPDYVIDTIALSSYFVCENNNFAIHSRLSERSAQENLYKFAEVYNIPTHVLKDSDIFKLHNLSNTLVDKIRNGSGPHFIEAYTYRWLEHVGPQEDWGLNYRSEEEILQWKIDDQVNRLREMISPIERKNIDKKIKYEVISALKFAEQSPFPSEKELYKNVYK